MLFRDACERGKNVLHVEPTQFYGGFQEATVRMEALTHSMEGFPKPKEKLGDYQIDLCPRLLHFGVGEAEELIRRDLAAYVEFISLEHHGIVIDEPGSQCASLISIPYSKEDLMRHQRLSLVEKRQCMRLLLSTRERLGDNESQILLDSVSSRVRDLLLFGICQFHSRKEIHWEAIPTFIKAHATASGSRPDNNSTFLLYPFGGTSSILQAYCRKAAVRGAIHLLNQADTSITDHPDQDNQFPWRAEGLFEERRWLAWTNCVLRENPSGRLTAWRSLIILNSVVGIANCSGLGFFIIPPEEKGDLDSGTIFCLQLDHRSGLFTNTQHLMIYFWAFQSGRDSLTNCLNRLFKDRQELVLLQHVYQQ